ncbi:hypothetical protein BC792_101107 [Sphingobacterium allocomposti]|jgi:FKBP-type peptidyl-prolyl cis-trans isomerase FkpA|uniref:Peptidylprolyl isomerase n=1 Tax=Sphingobacterium allocomposti TaxID=415956 RepID=A0A5S5DR97_9SPHI|nr:hypothetical protein [Sphingobacterium composti Yoo et al. 2007 non Ten et al. 2007]TYP98453.1 hypothetical protein BC792_101107 [Sphingobacterium composti Yoo et al. 2007 non Ten et al. 2007]
MKTLFKPLFAVIVAAIALTSCMKSDDTDYEAEALKQERALDSLFSAEKLKINDYLASAEGNWVKDTVTMSLPRLGKKIERGIWSEILAEPTEEDDKAYEYKVQNVGYNQHQIVPPTTVKLKYAVYSLTSQTPLKQDATGSDYNFSNTNTHLTVAWFIGFSPYTVKHNGENANLLLLAGLTEKGLKKGSKIRIIAPSYWSVNPYTGQKNADYLPANAPVIYEFEVMNIQ